MGNRRRKFISIGCGNSILTLSVIAAGSDFLRVEGTDVHKVPTEFTFTTPERLGLSIGRIDWVDGDRLQILVERFAPLIC